jgi:hypothetical protein
MPRFCGEFLILDCCFTAYAYNEFQSGPLQAGRIRLLGEFPRGGAALLCSASSRDVSLAPGGFLLGNTHRPIPYCLPKLHSMPPTSRMTVAMHWPIRWPRTRCHGTSRRPMPSSIMARQSLASWVEPPCSRRHTGNVYALQIAINSFGNRIQPLSARAAWPSSRGSACANPSLRMEQSRA